MENLKICETLTKLDAKGIKKAFGILNPSYNTFINQSLKY